MVVPQAGEPTGSALTSQGPSMRVGTLPVAIAAGPAPGSSAAVKTVVSPLGLFPKETAALTAAIKRARFNADGSIASGESAISEAASAAARKANGKYVLTLYIKVSQGIKPDDGAALDTKVRSINALLMRTLGSTAGAPRS